MIAIAISKGGLKNSLRIKSMPNAKVVAKNGRNEIKYRVSLRGSALKKIKTTTKISKIKIWEGFLFDAANQIPEKTNSPIKPKVSNQCSK
jgi:hypothetical protein